MSIKKNIEVDPKAMEIIDLLHETIKEEEEINPEMANRIEKFVEYENKKWIIKNKDEVLNLNEHETTAIDYLVIRKMMEISNIINLDNEENFKNLSEEIRSYYNNLSNDNVINFTNAILLNINGENKAFNLCNNLEDYIINCDDEYAANLDKQVDWFYENYLDYENRKVEEKENEEVELVSEEIDDDEVEETRSINTLSEWVEELGNYIVVDKTLKLRK